MDALPQLVLTLTFATTGLVIAALPAEPQTMFMPLAPRSIRTFGVPALAFSRAPVSRHQGRARMGYQYAWIADNRDPAVRPTGPAGRLPPKDALGRGRRHPAGPGHDEVWYAAPADALHLACFRKGA